MNEVAKGTKAFEMRGTTVPGLSGEGILRAEKSGGVRKATLMDARISFVLRPCRTVSRHDLFHREEKKPQRSR